MIDIDRTRTKIILDDLVRSRLHKGTAREVAARHGCSHQYIHKILSWLPHRPKDQPFDPNKRQRALMKVSEDDIVDICSKFIFEHTTRLQLREEYHLTSTALNEIFYTITDTFHTQTNIGETNMLPALEVWRQASNISNEALAEKLGDKFYNLKGMRYGWRNTPVATADAIKAVTGIPYSKLYAEYFDPCNEAARFFLKQALENDDGSDELLGALAWAYWQMTHEEDEEDNAEENEE